MGAHAPGRRVVLMHLGRLWPIFLARSPGSRGAAWLLWAGALSAPELAFAAEGAEKKPIPVSFELARGRTSLGLRGVLADDSSELRFWSCPERGPCPEPELSVRVPLPEASRGLAVERSVQTIEGIPLLSLALASPQSPFQVLVVPAARAEGGLPAVAFAGELRPGEALRFSADGQVLIEKLVHACDDPSGREVFAKVRRLDVKRREFVRARHSLLSEAEIAQAESVQAAEATPALPSAIVPLTGSTGEAASWVVGDAPGKTPWAAVAFRAEGRKSLRLELEQGGETELFLIRPDRTLRVRVPASETARSVALSLLPDAAAEGAPGCFLLTTGRAGAPVRAASLLEEQKPYGSPESWVRELSGPSAALYQSALLSEAGLAARAIESEFPSLESVGRAHAIEILTEVSGDRALGALLVVAAVGSTVERERALGALADYESAEVFARAETAFTSTRGVRAPGLALVMAHFDPERALPKIAARLAEPRRRSKNLKQREEELAVRKELRAALSVAVAHASRPTELAALLASKDVGQTARVELLRAYGLRRRTLGFPLAPYLAELGTNFGTEYVLLQLEMEVFNELPQERRNRVIARLGARSDPSFKPLELLAYQARLLELLTEADLSRETRAHFRRGAIRGLESSSRIVRQGSLLFLRGSETRATEAEAALILRLLDEDAWAEVRAEAAISYGSLAALLGAEARDRQEEELEDRLKPNRDDLIVSRGLVRALAKSGGPRAREALLSVLDRKGLSEARGDAADALGRLCERSATQSLTERALRLQSPASESDVTIGLASVRALARLAPADLGPRLSVLMDPKVPGPIRGQVTMILESTPASCQAKK